MSLSLELQFTLSLKPSLPVCHSKEKLLARKLKVNTNGLIAVKLHMPASSCSVLLTLFSCNNC